MTLLFLITLLELIKMETVVNNLLQPTHNIPKKGFIGMRSSSPAIGYHRADSESLRNPFLGILSPLGAT